MNINYQKKLDEILKNINGETLLLHSCCAPCSSYVLEYLSNYFKITVFYYNPNISPDTEYEKRVKEQKEFIKKFKSKYPIDIIEGDYDKDKFYEISNGLENEIEGGKRCFKCYELRLKATAGVAKEKNYDYFGTTLTVSPYKNSKKLNEIGELLQNEYGINYLFSDFKKKNGYKRSIELSKEYNLYRQDYCGCEFSKRLKIKENDYEKETV
ncbi:MAG: epoxyqueuosine reductase QueH [Bacilli bacterium]|nr:epoxyqueuosine reductase QueH [Bacilli bacterium]